MTNRIKKHCVFDKDTLDFIEAYAASTGNSFAAANEQLIKLGASNIQEVESLTMKNIAAIQTLEHKLNTTREELKKSTNRLAALQVTNIKLSAANHYFLKEVLRALNISDTVIESMVKSGQKFGAEILSKKMEELENVQES